MNGIIGAFLNDFPGDGFKPAFAAQATARGYAVRFLDYGHVSDAELEGLTCLFGHPGAEVLGRTRNLAFFCNCWAGMDAYREEDLAGSPGCLVTNSSGAYGLMIAEHVVMALLMLYHRQREYDILVRAGEWHRVSGTIDTLYGKRVTLLGTGDIGREVAKRLRPFGVACIRGVSRSGRAVEGFDDVHAVAGLDALLPETDILICAVPGTGETRGLLTRERLVSLPRGAVFCNVGRGSLVDQDALTELLVDGRLGGAVVDVTEPEPLGADHPLRFLDNVILTPHIAGSLVALEETCRRTVAMFFEDLDRFTAGQPLRYTASLERGY